MMYLRTIKNGAVRINGTVYRPRNTYMEYDGRLDGLRYAFATYDGESFVSLWGNAKLYCKDEMGCWEYVAEVVDGAYPWTWWEAEKDLDKQAVDMG